MKYEPTELLADSGGSTYEFLTLVIRIGVNDVVTINRENGVENVEIEFFNGHGEQRLKMPYKLFKQYLLKIDEHFDGIASLQNK